MFYNFSIKMKNCKTFYEGQTVSLVKEIIQPLHHPSLNQIKSYYGSGAKIFLRRYTEIYRHLLSKCFRNAVLERQEMMQCKFFFLTPNRKMLAGTFVKLERFLAVLQGHIIFNVKWVEVHKMSEIFWAKLYRKTSELFC